MMAHKRKLMAFDTLRSFRRLMYDQSRQVGHRHLAAPPDMPIRPMAIECRHGHWQAGPVFMIGEACWMAAFRPLRRDIRQCCCRRRRNRPPIRSSRKVPS